MTNQSDLFGPGPQGDLFGDADQPVRDYRPDPERVRRELLSLLELARGSQSLPWSRAKAKYWRTVFPQMANWLPDDEAAQLRFDFAREMERLDEAA